MKIFNRCFSIFIIFIMLFSFNEKEVSAYTKEEIDKNNVTDFINNIFKIRNNFTLSGDLENFKDNYDLKNNYGKWSFEHEVKRAKYLRDWASERGMIIKSIESIPNFKKVTLGKNSATVRVDEGVKVTYGYSNDKDNCENVFGVNLFHNISLKINDSNMVIINDYYLDCFEDGLKTYEVNYSETLLPAPKEKNYDFVNNVRTNVELSSSSKFDRLKAVSYADTYCGVPWATGKEINKYNTRYKNFTGVGGNCTNYVSQCLGDKDAGSLKQDGTWYCIYKGYNGAETSASWSNADAFKNYLLYSGKGKLVKKGDFKEVTKPLKESSNGAIGKLTLGDVIAYDKGNDIDHTAIITGFDSHGYPLINSHTVDRYHVPFDLGWGDKNIKFLLIHIQ
ncbi:amidase domain-containing protein [Clostridium hydrogeniformans]|uniref:amidase domain-containing protein n=1 Tax=Clostridium hydrogeniformans TaxID=349933 RepID=UPI0004844E78|nr:amidase domain-containing protein [Clostridium hydrogeniformans]